MLQMRTALSIADVVIFVYFSDVISATAGMMNKQIRKDTVPISIIFVCKNDGRYSREKKSMLCMYICIQYTFVMAIYNCRATIGPFEHGILILLHLLFLNTDY